MAERKEYRNARRSRKMIRDAFLGLLQEKPFAKITATDIINRADVNRSTFYAHYPDVKGLVEEIIGEIIDFSTTLIREADYQDFLENPRPYVEKFIRLGDKYRGLYAMVDQNNFVLQQINQLQNALLEKALSAPGIPEAIRGSKKYEIRVHFFIGGIFNTYQQWMVGILKCSAEEIISEISEMIVSSSGAVLQTLSRRD